ncbi:MAG: 2-hydroxyacid dehydrogenase [Candidatus Melainabacteria bacterium]
MPIAVYSTKPYDKAFFLVAAPALGVDQDDFLFIESRLDTHTAALAAGCGAVCAFVNDDMSGPVLTRLHAGGVRLIALRSAGYNHVDLAVAKALGITVARVPAYSPYAVAEHAVALMLTLNRKTHRAFNRVKEGNFSLDGLMGFDMHGKTVGIVGTGQIGEAIARLLVGFGCRVLAYDVTENPRCTDMGIQYVPLETLYAESMVITLHCPLLPETHHMINAGSLLKMKRGVMLINTSRGGLIDTQALIPALKSGQVGYLGLDVYEEEGPLFFEDLSNTLIQDDVLMRLTSFPNVLITGHQAFFTEDAMENIAYTTLRNIRDFTRAGQPPAVNTVVGPLSN